MAGGRGSILGVFGFNHCPRARHPAVTTEGRFRIHWRIPGPSPLSPNGSELLIGSLPAYP